MGIQSHHRSSLKLWNSFQRSYKLTAGVERFLRYSGDTVENGDTTLMLFMSPVGIDLLKQSKVWYADGTFSTAPVPYA